MSENLDRALDALSDPNQHTDEASYGTAPDPTRCWRCDSEPVNDVGVCEDCAAWLRGERETDPALARLAARHYDDDATFTWPAPEYGAHVSENPDTIREFNWVSPDFGDDGWLPADTIGPAQFESGGSDPIAEPGLITVFDGSDQERIRFDTEGITFFDEQGTSHLFIPADGSGIYRLVGNERRDLTRPKLHPLLVATPLGILWLGAFLWLTFCIVWALR